MFVPVLWGSYKKINLKYFSHIFLQEFHSLVLSKLWVGIYNWWDIIKKCGLGIYNVFHKSPTFCLYVRVHVGVGVCWWWWYQYRAVLFTTASSWVWNSGTDTFCFAVLVQIFSGYLKSFVVSSKFLDWILKFCVE